MSSREKVHGFEYPVGERIIVKLTDMSSANIDTSFIESKFQETFIKAILFFIYLFRTHEEGLILQRFFTTISPNGA